MYGLEIGGPSAYFKQNYLEISGCDNVIFSNKTIWGNYGEDYIINGKVVGKNFIQEATDLSLTKKYDFVLASNVIEHIANPLKAVREWIGVLKPNGLITIVAPKKESNFDHRRGITEFSHLIRDFENNIGEDDLTHLDEILSLHDLPLDPPAGTLEQFKERSLKNIENRCLHHHVFDLALLKQIVAYFDLSLIRTIETDIDYCIIAQK
jgi:SAM-dependent methyltransferase